MFSHLRNFLLSPRCVLLLPGCVPGRTLPVTQQINGRRPKSPLLPGINMMSEYDAGAGIAYSFQVWH